MGKVKSWAMDREERAAARGAADKYYGRYPVPHFWKDSLGGTGTFPSLKREGFEVVATMEQQQTRTPAKSNRFNPFHIKIASK